jgi:hypothetical protein
MVFATLLLLSPLPLFGDMVLPVSNPAPIATIISAESSSEVARPELSMPSVADSLAASELAAAPSIPSMPQPKLDAVAESSSAEPAAAQPRAFAFEPIKPVTSGNFDNRNQKKTWYGLMAAGHAGAAFDAWSTRRALSGNYGTEADPLMRPFAHSGAIYAATQVSPAIMDLIGRRAMTSERPWVRRLWWVPQSVGASLSFQAGIHNVGVVH